MARTVAEDLELPLEKLGFYDLPYTRHHFPNSWNPTGGKEVHVRFLQNGHGHEPLYSEAHYVVLTVVRFKGI